MPTRPSDREIHNRLEEAKASLRERVGLFANPAKVVGELNDLNIQDSEEIWALIRILLEEIKPKNYAGGRPPQKSYEKCITNHELFAFSWWSEKLEKKMYLKFALKNRCFYYVSLHECRSLGKVEKL